MQLTTYVTGGHRSLAGICLSQFFEHAALCRTSLSSGRHRLRFSGVWSLRLRAAVQLPGQGSGRGVRARGGWRRGYLDAGSAGTSGQVRAATWRMEKLLVWLAPARRWRGAGGRGAKARVGVAWTGGGRGLASASPGGLASRGAGGGLGRRLDGGDGDWTWSDSVSSRHWSLTVTGG